MAARRRRTRIEGARELDQVLAELPKQMRGQVLRRALMAGATIIRKAMRARAPRAEGKLIKSIAARRDKGAERGGASVAVKVGPLARAFYGMFAEFGTSHQPARPWARPAYEESKRAALDRIGEMLGQSVEKAAKRLAGPLAKSGLVKKRRRR